MECGIEEEKEKNMSHEISLEQVQSWSLFVERETSRFPELLAEAHWQAAYAPDELIQRIRADLMASDSLAKLNQRLRYHRRAEMVRIAIRDLKGLARWKKLCRICPIWRTHWFQARWIGTITF